MVSTEADQWLKLGDFLHRAAPPKLHRAAPPKSLRELKQCLAVLCRCTSFTEGISIGTLIALHDSLFQYAGKTNANVKTIRQDSWSLGHSTFDHFDSDVGTGSLAFSF
jgi:hypothetical protein